MAAGVKDFLGVEHRLDMVRNWHDVEWYNDSFQAPERTMQIRSFSDLCPSIGWT